MAPSDDGYRGWGSQSCRRGLTSPAQPEIPISDSDIGPLKVVGLERFELSTSRLSSARSNQLSYRPVNAADVQTKKEKRRRRCPAGISRNRPDEPIAIFQ